MKMKQLILFVNVLFLVVQLSAQGKKDTCCLDKKELLGIWQRNSNRVGDGLEQYFQFLADGSFVLHFCSEDEDIRGIYAITGKYRLVKNGLYLTIISRTVAEGGKIALEDYSETYHTFILKGSELKEIKEADPKELRPLRIIIDEPGKIELGNETYYKLSKQNLKALNIDPDVRQ